MRIGIVASRYNEDIVSRLTLSAIAALVQHGVSEDDIRTVWVPGAVEIPLVAQRLARGGDVHAVIALGAVIRGETAHFEYVARMVADGTMRVTLDTGVPVIFGVLTTDGREHALARTGGGAGDKGWEAALSAMHMIRTLAALP
jgi:6,7-dimethyl-8-ribityllumazine synthase